MLSPSQANDAIIYNNRANGTIWALQQLPAPLAAAWASSGTSGKGFALEVAKLQSMLGLKVDGKLGPQTLKNICRNPVPAAPEQLLLGVDVSGYQNRPQFDFAKIRTAGLSFAFVKVTQESFNSNKDAEWQTELFYDMGIAVGFYHFCDASEPARKQAELLRTAARKLAKGRPYLPLVLDYEWFDDHNKLKQAAHRKWLVESVGALRELDGRDPCLYTGPNAWKQFLGGPLPELGNVHLWTVDYSKPEAPPTLPPGFASYTFRQFTGSGRIPGYSGDIDLNHFRGDVAALKQLTQA